MSESRFFRYELRTTDVDAARAFYIEVLGPQIWGAEVQIARLPEQVAARGAPAHWLGHVGIHTIQETAERIVGLGGQQLGPMQGGTGGSRRAILRDPFGAILALSDEFAVPERASAPERFPAPKRSPAPERAPVAWHLLHARDHERALALYSDLFGWTAGGEVSTGPEVGRQRLFGWDDSGRSVGSAADIAHLPHIHPQWLFFFQVANLESAAARARAAGGNVLEPMRTWSGDLIVPCEDPQGAAFGLFEFAGEPG